MERFFFYASVVTKSFFTGLTGAVVGAVGAVMLSAAVIIITLIGQVLGGSYVYYHHQVAPLYATALNVLCFSITGLPIAGFVSGFLYGLSKELEI